MSTPIEEFMRVRFPSPEAALAFDARVLGAVSTAAGVAELILGSSRAVVLAPGLHTDSDRSVRYLSRRAHRHAIHNGAKFVAERRVDRNELPSGTVLIVGPETDRPQRRKSSVEHRPDSRIALT